MNEWFAEELRANKSIHLAFQNHSHPEKLAAAMLSEDDALISFREFYRAVIDLVGNYDINLLEQEYCFAVARTHVVVEWKYQIIPYKDVLPNVKWEESLHPFGCKDHEKFWNRIWAINDSFWKNNMPADRPDCQCFLRSTDEPVTDNSDIYTEE